MFSHVAFQNLKKLTLKSCIDSLEPLIWMDCPALNSLTIESTLVSNPKSLDKLFCIKLRYLRMAKNKIPSIELSRIKIKRGSNLLVIYTLQPYEYRGHRQITEEISVQDISKLSKAEISWGCLKRGQKFCINRVQPNMHILKKMN